MTRKKNYRLDGNAKKAIHQKSLVSTILRLSVSRLRHMKNEEIFPLVDPSIKGEKVRGLSEEMELGEQPGVRLDSLFEVVGSDGERFLVNVEIQGNPVDYALVKRGEFYLASMMISEKGTVFLHDEYNGICPVYSIWFVLNPPAAVRGTWNHYCLCEKQVEGQWKEKGVNYQLMELDVINLGLGDPKAYNGNALMEILSYLFESELTDKERAETLRGYGIEFEEEDESNMRMLDEIVAYKENKASEKAYGIGRTDGRTEGIEIGRTEGINEAYTRIARELAKQYDCRTIAGMMNLPLAEVQRFLK